MWDPVFDTGAASSACPYGSDCSDCTAYVAATPTSAGYFPTRCGQALPPARTATSVAAEIATDVRLEANFDAIFDSDDRRRLAAATSVASPDRNPDRPADRPADRPTARRLLKGASAYGYSSSSYSRSSYSRSSYSRSSVDGYDVGGGRPYDPSHSLWDKGMRGGRSATYGTERWGAAASSVRRRAPVYSGAGAGVHFTGGVSSAPYYYGQRSVRHNSHLMVLTSSHFHHHNGDHDCGGVTYDRVACKHASSYLTPEDLDRYELAEAFALPPIPPTADTPARRRWRATYPALASNLSAQWPLELTVHELLLYPPDATEGRAPPALLGFSTNDASTVDTRLRLYETFVLSLAFSFFALVCVGSLLAVAARCLGNAVRRACARCVPSLARKPGSSMV